MLNYVNYHTAYLNQTNSLCHIIDRLSRKRLVNVPHMPLLLNIAQYIMRTESTAVRKSIEAPD